TAGIDTLSLHDALPISLRSVFDGQHFQSAVLVGVNADVASNFQSLLDNLVSTQIGIFQQRTGRSLGKRAAGADGNQALFRFDDRSEEHTSELQSRENLV